jgi:hypothetical protein
MLSAADVIKNVAVAFPGTGAKVIQDASGQKFVIAGLGFRQDTRMSLGYIYWRFEEHTTDE